MAKEVKKTDDGFNLSLKVSKKGGVQLDGLRRFPVTLYADEWEAVLSRSDSILAFIKSNRTKLKTKAEANDADRQSI